MSLKRPNSVLLTAKRPPQTAVDLMQNLTTEGYQDCIVCVQSFKKFEWCVTLSSKEACESVEERYEEGEDKDFVSRRLRENEQGKCTLEGVPYEFSNTNIRAQLDQYFERFEIEMETHKNVPDGMGTIYTGNRTIKFHSIKKPPPNRLRLGKGVTGWINDLKQKDMQEYIVKCRNCLEEGHIGETCTRPPKCTKCLSIGHTREKCEEENCTECMSQFHTTETCPRSTSARQRGWQGQTYAERVQVHPTSQESLTQGKNWMMRLKDDEDQKKDDEKIESIIEIEEDFNLEQELQATTETRPSTSTPTPTHTEQQTPKEQRPPKDKTSRKSKSVEKAIRSAEKEINVLSKEMVQIHVGENQTEGLEHNIDQVNKVISKIEDKQTRSAKRALLQELQQQLSETDSEDEEEDEDPSELKIVLGKGEDGEWVMGSQAEERVKKKALRRGKPGEKKKVSPIQKLGNKLKDRFSQANQSRRSRLSDEGGGTKKPKK